MIADFRLKLAAIPNEIPGLRLAIVEGRVNGSAYEGECACFVGTIANLQGCNYHNIPGIAPDSWSHTERFFLAIRQGDTPENNPCAALAVKWIDEYLAESTAAPETVAAE